MKRPNDRDDRSRYARNLKDPTLAALPAFPSSLCHVPPPLSFKYVAINQSEVEDSLERLNTLTINNQASSNATPLRIVRLACSFGSEEVIHPSRSLKRRHHREVCKLNADENNMLLYFPSPTTTHPLRFFLTGESASPHLTKARPFDVAERRIRYMPVQEYMHT